MACSCPCSRIITSRAVRLLLFVCCSPEHCSHYPGWMNVNAGKCWGCELIAVCLLQPRTPQPPGGSTATHRASKSQRWLPFSSPLQCPSAAAETTPCSLPCPTPVSPSPVSPSPVSPSLPLHSPVSLPAGAGVSLRNIMAEQQDMGTRWVASLPHPPQRVIVSLGPAVPFESICCPSDLTSAACLQCFGSAVNNYVKSECWECPF